MRFLHINHRYAPFVGGSERYIQEVSERLAVLAHDVNLVTSNAFDLEYFWDPSRRQVEAPANEHLNGVNVHRVAVRHPPLSSVLFQGSRRALGELSRVPGMPALPGDLVARRLPWLPDLASALRRSGPSDLVHATNLGLEGLGITAASTARAWDVPFLFTPFIHLGRDGDAVSRRYVTMPHQKRLLQSANHINAMTQLEANFLEYIGIDPMRITVCGVGVNLPEITGGDGDAFRRKRRITGRLVGVASAVAFDKGSRDLVLAISRLRSQGHDVELVLAGPRLRRFDRWFDEQDERTRAGVHVTGFISESEKRDMLSAIDVLAMPSRTESFGIAFLEGWANGKPVIAADAGAVPEIVKDGENGLLVRFGDVSGLARSILTLLEDDHLAARLGKAGYRLTAERYTWSAVLQRVLAGYSAALGFDLEAE